MIVIYVVVGLIVLAGLVGDPETLPEAEATTTTAAVTTTEGPTTTTVPPTTTLPPTTTSTVPPTTTSSVPPLETIGSGTYIVGDEIEPGLYRVAGYWARLDGNLDIIDNDLISDNGLSLVYVFEDDAYLEISGEAIAYEDFPGLAGTRSVNPILAEFTEGTYIVDDENGDLAPGRYRVTPEAGSTAYWARLEPNTREIIDNGLSEGQLIAVIQDGEWFQFTGNLERIEE